MKKRFFIPACVLSAAAVGFVIFAMGHPELSFPWDGWITGILYGLYADAVVLLFILAFCKKMTLLNILSIIFRNRNAFSAGQKRKTWKIKLLYV